MVKETRIIFDTKNIKAVRIRCNVKDCGGVTLYSFGKHLHPSRCAICGEEWRASDQNYSSILKLLDCIKILQDANLTWPLTVAYEIDGDADAP